MSTALEGAGVARVIGGLPVVGQVAVRESVTDRSTAVAEQVAARFADEVDQMGRFPHETLTALANAGLLGVLVPEELGGEGATLTEACRSVLALGRHCASSAMVLAMHHLQVACLVRHGGTRAIEDLLRRVAAEQLLLASATSEVGIGGRMRQSGCALEVAGDGFTLEKQAPTVSYGTQADAVLITARRTPDSPPGDQVLVAGIRPDVTLEQMSEWDTLGLRGTCSPGFVVRAQGSLDLVLSDPFADIAAETMLPYSHMLWSHVWLGIASSAAARAGTLVRKQARKDPGTTPPAARRLAELGVVLQQLEHLVVGSLTRFDEEADGRRASSMADALALNSLKVGASTLMVDVVTKALGILGMEGYRNGTPLSVGRHLRDAHGAVVMVNNDRILGDNAQMLLIAKESM